MDIAHSAHSRGIVCQFWMNCLPKSEFSRLANRLERKKRSLNHRRAVGDRSLSYRFGVISIQTIRASCIRGLLGTICRYLGQSHVLGEAEKALSPKRTIPPVPSDLITSRPSLVEMSETLFMDSWNEQFFFPVGEGNRNTTHHASRSVQNSN